MGFDPPGEPSPRRWRLGVIVSSAVLLVVVLGFAAPDPVIGAIGIGRLFAPQPHVIATGAPKATPTRTPQADDIKDLVAKHGEPPDATFARLRIPRLGVDAGVSPRIVSGAEMPLPDGPQNVAWYDLSRWQGLGGRPGEGGNAIFGAHVDYNNHVEYAKRRFIGPAIFFYLDRLSPGDVIEVQYQGRTLKYQVVWVKPFQAAGTDWGVVWSSNVKKDSVTLFTCGGTFDPGAQEYSERLIVRAERL
ncbi:MAG: class F sortase [Chloroflexi bacterium]|nr:class F sortase [Chloroflexota bacterium]